MKYIEILKSIYIHNEVIIREKMTFMNYYIPQMFRDIFNIIFLHFQLLNDRLKSSFKI